MTTLREAATAVATLVDPESLRDDNNFRGAAAIEALSAALATPEPDVKALPAIGGYVLATKWDDGDPGDHWAVGFYAGTIDGCHPPRYRVLDSEGRNLRLNGFRRVARIRKDVGCWLITVAAKQLEASPPGTVNIWTMLTPAAFDLSQESEE